MPGFLRRGVLFRDVKTLLKDGDGFRAAVDRIAGAYAGAAIDRVAAIESRGFIVGAPVAIALSAGFVPVRKGGKLPP